MKNYPICPKCGESYYRELYRTTTLLGWTPLFKDGVLLNSNPNISTVHCECMNCKEYFNFEEKE